MRYISPSRQLIAWLLVLAGCAGSTIWLAADQEWLHASIFELLPRTEHDLIVERASNVAERELSRRLTFLIGHASRDTAKTVSEEIARQLDRHELIEAATARIDETRVTRFGEFYFPYRQQLLSDEQIALIGLDDGRGAVRAALAKLYGLLAVGGGSIADDPFLLFQDSIEQLRPAAGNLELDDGYLWATGNEKQYVLVSATTTTADLSMDEQKRLVSHVESAIEAAAAADAEVLFTGFVFFAHAGTESAKSEISLIGTGSLIGIVMLMIAAFRSLRPLYLALASIGCGCALAFTVTMWTFGSIHLTTLVFGAALVGVSVDYALHYLSHELLGPADWTPELGLRSVMPGMTMGLITSATAFLALALAPFPGLKQLAVFASAGLLGAFVTLVLFARLTRSRVARADRPMLGRLGAAYFALWDNIPANGQRALLGAICVLAVLGLPLLDFDDDVAILQERPPALIAQEEQVAKLLGAVPSNVFLLVRGTDPEHVLETEESLRTRLDALIENGALQGYQAISRHVPSQARQRRSAQAYGSLLRHQLDGYLAELGVTNGEQAAIGGRLAAAGDNRLPLEDWLAHPVSSELRLLWLGHNDEAASIVLLEGLRDSDMLRRSIEAEPNVTVVDKARDLSNLLGDYRVRAMTLLGGALIIVLGLLSARYGIRRAVILPLPPLLGGVLALVAISAFGASLNLFNLLALILVFGIGIDATLFIAEAKHSLAPTVFAVTLSAITTMLSFGLLSLSTTYAVQSFGLTVLIGITCAYLLAPAALNARSGPNRFEMGG